MHFLLRFSFLLLLVSLETCRKDVPVAPFKTRHVVVVTIDGPRWSETWGDSAGHLIPFRHDTLAPLAVRVGDFNNDGFTYTSAGHTALLTGVYQSIANDGSEKPDRPNFLQSWLERTRLPAGKAWMISSKDKIEALMDCEDPGWSGKYIPSNRCGVNGLGSGYCNDSVTFNRALAVLRDEQPVLTFIHFAEPDVSGHSGNWNNYLAGVRSTDAYLGRIWKYLQSNPEYAGNTTLIVTNDHGRHLDSFGGFSSHGDNCTGCRHIELIAAGAMSRWL